MAERDIVRYLLELNRLHSQEFCSAAAHLARGQYRANHPTRIGVFMCMDGRIHFATMTQTPLGIIEPWRNLGGQFNLGWPLFQVTVRDSLEETLQHGHNRLFIVTYHLSRGDRHRGCRGFDNEAGAAQAFTRDLTLQFARCFGQQAVYTIQCGIETDEDALILHGEDDGTFNCADLKAQDATWESLEAELRALYPRMQERILLDLLPLVQGNIRHVAATRAMRRPISDVEHKECVLGIGRGFDWLHMPNLALIVGPFAPDLTIPIKTAASLLLGNIREGRIKASETNGVVLLAAGVYRGEDGLSRVLAEEKARFLRAFTLDVVHNHVPELQRHLRALAGVVNINTRALTVLEE